MIKIWPTPAGTYSRLYDDMLNQVHLLIAGASGSGKSTVINGLIHRALLDGPGERRFILIDPKGTELDEYKDFPHTLVYSQKMPDCVNALRYALGLTKTRFADMKRRKLRMYDGSDVYLIIDELMYFTNQPQYKRETMALLQDILVIARACRIHVIAATQNCTTTTIPASLRCNFDSRVGLRTSTAQDSRNIIGVRGCEKFPNPTLAHESYGYYMHGGEMEVYKIPKVEESERQRIIDHWTHAKPRYKLFA